MHRMERDIWRITLAQLVLRPRTGWSNLRFILGMRIGGFKEASRESRRK